MGWFSRRSEEQVAVVADRQERMENDLRELTRQVSSLGSALVVREPATATAAQAYDGLRKAVMAGAQARRLLLVQLVELSDMLDHDVAIEDLRSFAQELRLRANLGQDLDAVAHPNHFEVLDGSGNSVRVVKPAWVDDQTGALIRRGMVERFQSQALPAAAPTPAVAPSVPTPSVAPPPHAAGGDQTTQSPGPFPGTTGAGVAETPVEAATVDAPPTEAGTLPVATSEAVQAPMDPGVPAPAEAPRPAEAPSQTEAPAAANEPTDENGRPA